MTKSRIPRGGDPGSHLAGQTVKALIQTLTGALPIPVASPDNQRFVQNGINRAAGTAFEVMPVIIRIGCLRLQLPDANGQFLAIHEGHEPNPSSPGPNRPLVKQSIGLGTVIGLHHSMFVLREQFLD